MSDADGPDTGQRDTDLDSTDLPEQFRIRQDKRQRLLDGGTSPTR